MSEQEIFRRKSLEELKSRGIDPYPADEYIVTDYSTEIKRGFREDSPRWEVSVAGRMMSRRIMGKVSFVELQDSVGRIQLYIKCDSLCPNENKDLYYIVFKKLLDIGDFIGIKGYVFCTQTGEISIHVNSLTLLSKSLRPLPIVKSKDGMTYDSYNDVELRYRQRYVDLIVNEGTKDIFLKRTKIFNSVRSFFNEKGYIEVDTPVLQSIPGGAAARPFVTHHNALDIPCYLRIANELYLKRLIVGGFEGVYEFSRNFRNEGIDKVHNPEFTVVEVYVSYKDYKWMMNFTEQMLEHICIEILGSTELKIGEYIINFKAPYRRITMIDVIEENTGVNIAGMNENQLREVCRFLHIEEDKTMSSGKLIDEIFGKKCEWKYIQPTFIIDYPKEMSPLCKCHRQNAELTERFELIVNGFELANAYSELNDPIDQRKRFEDQLKLSKKGDNEAMFIDQDFLRALEYGMPPTSGMGIGMDRLVMLLTKQTSIQEVLLFPHMRPEKLDY
ncbi:lysyl-tRNA synthetase [Candidatus Azobacteroides pseudotrichonymphae genomovar. CFP2]|uniref:Lysine--tRNA ligase n=1 Tax=Azobacteroides pseudotrichonymphae genomovar. CFP2 TaxID=511995 RepID=SYK_AZOPC|nr:RecName: Full=Lysine--tRNA ligase; AltName: Full=Lysyl-tRNA synthetase; Short=LysRS [Candidatus Azobacteroides pseudotrichonymphae genomovar. CFP2]BAG83889.1 lysyl-tRNA synthetase [Candidatus Azobacteroides pseudotrichonymphae genomovar. CFP2]